MTCEEALQETAKRIELKKLTHEPSVLEYYQLVKEALEKQIPKRPKIKEVGFKSISYDCPICENYLVSEIDNELVAGQKYNYCHKCGQRLDWSDIT